MTIPLILSFGGVTISLGADVMMGNIKVNGEYEATLEDMDVVGAGVPVPLEFSGKYEAEISWKVYSVTVQAVAYVDIFYLFSFYTGFGLTGGYGNFSTDFNGSGDLNCNHPSYGGANPVDTLKYE